MASGSISKTAMWILMGLLIVGLAGFGAVSFTGTQRTVGSVGDQEISVGRYARTLQNEIRAMEAETRQPITFQQAQALGIPQQVLSRLVVGAALDHEAFEMGISIGDAKLAQELRTIPSFQGPDGTFDRQAYAFTLQNAGLTEAQFEADLRAETARTILQGAVLAGVAMPDVYTDTLIAYAGERRAFTYAVLDDTDLSVAIAMPTDSALRAWYDANIARFTLPESKMITYAWLTPDMIIDTVEVDEATLRAAYEEREDEFNLPERRLVERLVFANEEAAQTAATAIAEGETSFDAAVESRGLALADVDMGDVTQGALDAAGAEVFAAQAGDVVGPLPSPLGPALYRVNAILSAQETPFDEAEPMLRDELALDRARRVLETLAQDFDDRLAGGATLEDLARDSEMQLDEIAWYAGVDAEIAAYDAFRTAASDVTESDFPTIEGLGDGGFFALRMDEMRPPTPQPFEEVREAVATGWQAEQVTDALTAQGTALVADLETGSSFTELGLTAREEAGLTRSAQVAGLPVGLLDAAFEMEPGDVRLLPGNGEVVVLRLDAVLPADPESEEAAMLAETLRNRASGDIAQDLYNALASDIQSRAGVEIDQTALNGIHTQFQ